MLESTVPSLGEGVLADVIWDKIFKGGRRKEENVKENGRKTEDEKINEN